MEFRHPLHRLRLALRGLVLVSALRRLHRHRRLHRPHHPDDDDAGAGCGVPLTQQRLVGQLSEVIPKGLNHLLFFGYHCFM